MDIITIINKKKDKKKCTKKEIAWLINSYMNKQIEDYQMSAFLMAVVINGLSDNEVFYLVDAIIKSGDITKSKYLLVDKHSTGGVGDKTTLILAPIIAASGLKMIKMSGKGLGHTGGTVDKLHAIKNFNTELTEKEIKNALAEVGVCLISNQGNIAPADKKLYQLRDVTATTNSIPLIAASIMSKKIASGAKVLVIDLKMGAGAFVKTKKEALELARLMKLIGNHYHVKTTCVISNMNEPLGYNIGNGLEVIECIEFLKGNYEKNLYDLVIQLAVIILSDGLKISKNKALEITKSILNSKQALNKFYEIIANQKGDIKKISISNKKQIIVSPKDGYISKIDAYKLGVLTKELGGGRVKINDQIDYGVGFVLKKKVGDYIKQGEDLVEVYYNLKDASILEILNCFKFSNSVKKKLIIEKII